MLGPRPIRDPISKRRLTAPKEEIQVVLWRPHRCVLTCTSTNVHIYTHMNTHTHTEVHYPNPDYVLNLHFQASLALFSPLYTRVSKELRLKSAQEVCVCWGWRQVTCKYLSNTTLSLACTSFSPHSVCWVSHQVLPRTKGKRRRLQSSRVWQS